MIHEMRTTFYVLKDWQGRLNQNLHLRALFKAKHLESEKVFAKGHKFLH